MSRRCRPQLPPLVDGELRTPSHRSTALALSKGNRPLVYLDSHQVTYSWRCSIIAELDSYLSQKGYAISDLATDSKLINHWYDVDFSGGVEKTTKLLRLTENLLNMLQPILTDRYDHDDNKGMRLADHVFVANLEHILLCLQNDLLRFLLFGKAWSDILEHIYECQKEQSRRCEAWFFEFPDARHPLSTTWPWSIRPSLAVLWGVCWMFYDAADYDFDAEQNLIGPDGFFLSAEDVRWIIRMFAYAEPGANYGEHSPLSLVTRASLLKWICHRFWRRR